MNRRGFLATILGLVTALLLPKPKVKPTIIEPVFSKATLTYKEYVALDSVIVKIAQERLRRWVDLQSLTLAQLTYEVRNI